MNKYVTQKWRRSDDEKRSKPAMSASRMTRQTSHVAVSIARQSCQYSLVPVHLDLTTKYGGSVGKLQRDVETQKIIIPASGVYIRSDRLSNKEGQDVFFLITAKAAGASSGDRDRTNNDNQTSAENQIPVWQHKDKNQKSWRFYSRAHSAKLTEALKEGTDMVLLDAGKQRWIVDLAAMEQRTMGTASRRAVRCLNKPKRLPAADVPLPSPEDDIARHTLQCVLHKKLEIGQIKRCEYNQIRRLSIQNSQPNEVLFCGYTYIKPVVSAGKRGTRRWSSIRRENSILDTSGYLLEQHTTFAAYEAGSDARQKRGKAKPKVSLPLRDCRAEFEDEKMQIEIRTSKGKKETLFAPDKPSYLAWRALLRFIMEGVSDKPCVFGVPLSAKHVPKHVINGTNVKVPAIVAQCCGLLVRHGLQIPSLFRIPGDEERCLKLMQQYEESDTVDLHKEFGVQGPSPTLAKRDAYDAASLLKMYLMKLPIPLIPTDHYHSFLQYGKLIQMKRQTMRNTSDPRVAGMPDPAVILRPAVSALPAPHRDCLGFIVHFLTQLTAHSKVNKMTPTAIGVCFAPTLLQPPEEDDAHMEENPQQALLDAGVCTKVISNMIEHADVIFDYASAAPSAPADTPLPSSKAPPPSSAPSHLAPAVTGGGDVPALVFDNDNTNTDVVEALAAEVVLTDMNTAQYAVEHGAQSMAQWSGCQTLTSFPILTYASTPPRVDSESCTLEYSSKELNARDTSFMFAEGKCVPMHIRVGPRGLHSNTETRSENHKKWGE